MSRLFFAEDIGGIQRLQVWYAFKCKVPDEGGKEKVWKGYKLLLGSKAKHLLPKQSVKFINVRYGSKLLRK